jgi:hypothetical protein
LGLGLGLGLTVKSIFRSPGVRQVYPMEEPPQLRPGGAPLAPTERNVTPSGREQSHLSAWDRASTWSSWAPDGKEKNSCFKFPAARVRQA